MDGMFKESHNRFMKTLTFILKSLQLAQMLKVWTRCMGIKMSWRLKDSCWIYNSFTIMLFPTINYYQMWKPESKSNETRQLFETWKHRDKWIVAYKEPPPPLIHYSNISMKQATKHKAWYNIHTTDKVQIQM